MCVFCLAVPQVDGAKDESVFVPRKKPAHLHYSDEIVCSFTSLYSFITEEKGENVQIINGCLKI